MPDPADQFQEWPPDAGGLSRTAHLVQDLRALLTSLTADLAAVQGRTSHPPDPDLKGLMQGLHDAGHIANDLLSEAHATATVRRPIEINQLVEDLRPELEHVAGLEVTLGVRTTPAPVTVVAHQAEIREILVNLVSNARESIADKGDVTIEVGPIYFVECGEGRRASTSRRHVRVSVADTGTGILPDIMSRIFDPFFSTKIDRTGLGLTDVAAIVKSLGGWLLVESRLGLGTRVHVCLPAI